MNEAGAAGFLTPFDARNAETESKRAKTILNLRAIPWARVVVDALLIAGLVLASSSLLSVR
jgi:hypothetical protein